VIYDAPPILKRADANLLAQHADGLVLVVRLDKTDRYALKQVLDNLKGFQIPILGAVINGEQSFDANSSSLTN
jgi:Mrp family chromosome partitioning ATPase